MAKIELTQGKYAIVDDDVFAELNKYKWYAQKDAATYYAHRVIHVNGKKKLIAMHRQLIGAEKGQIVDHINRDGLDNRKENLRIVSHLQNCANKSKSVKSKTSSIYRGVTFSKQMKKYKAGIRVDNKLLHLGYFSCEKEAALAYDTKAKEVWGIHAALNLGGNNG